jgi:hypothetical protein
MNQLTPAEKAKELYEWYYSLMYDSMNVDWSVEAKCAAIKNVDEILKSTGAVDWIGEKSINFKTFFDYYQEVKEELLKNY